MGDKTVGAVEAQERLRDLMGRARGIYRDRLKGELEPDRNGEIIAVEVESGEYFLGRSEIEAYDQAVKKHPGKKFAFLRVGSKTTHFVGAF